METRIRNLERTVEQQGYLLLILMFVLIFDTAAILVMWGEKGTPNFDHIAVSLTVFQTLFGIAALYGFWALRGLTKEKAEEVAEREVGKMVPPLVGRIVEEQLQTIGTEPISDEQLNQMVSAPAEGKKG
jgi:hypothetical protein